MVTELVLTGWVYDEMHIKCIKTIISGTFLPNSRLFFSYGVMIEQLHKQFDDFKISYYICLYFFTKYNEARESEFSGS